MTDKEVKEVLAKCSTIWRSADRSIGDMKIRLDKFNGDKTQQTKHLLNLDNLLNLSHRQAVDINAYQDLLSEYLFKIGELSSKLRHLELKAKRDKEIEEM
tara:strand:- start:118 stop:417 length:300 start_codon:yes stop_codon:yes gene_type:complete